MATKTVVTVTDDLDGSKAEETVHFALDGTEFEIDLSKAHAKDLRDALEPYLGAARKTGGRRSGRRRTTPSDKDEVRAIREWARQQGMQVSDRGRVPADIQNAYQQALRGSHPKGR